MKILLSILALTSTVLATEEPRWFVDETLVYEHGHALSEKYLQKKAPDFFQSLEKIQPWIVRIEARHSITTNGFKSNHGTGIILEDGTVLTAKHILTENVPEGETEKIILTRTDGNVLEATPARRGKEKDWALLKPDVEIRSPIRFAPPIESDTVVFLGYPARTGMDENGKAVPFNKDKPVGLLPLLVVATVDDTETMKLSPVAGFPPVGGMSGGPILNLKGEVVGLQTGVSKTTDDATGAVLYYKINTVSSDTIR